MRLHPISTIVALTPALLLACAGGSDRHTLARLRDAEPDTTDVAVDDGLDRAMAAYRRFLVEAPKSSLTPDAMRRLADLKIEKEYGALGGRSSEADPTEGLHHEVARIESQTGAEKVPPAQIASNSDSEVQLERRATSGGGIPETSDPPEIEDPGGDAVAWSGPEEAIELYDRILAAYPDYDHNDQVLYQKARAYDELGRNDEAIAVIDQLLAEYPGSRFIDEVQFRRGEFYFVRRKYLDAEESYQVVVTMGASSRFYELARYKLGWTFYKQELHEEALTQYLALLDHKVNTGYDFDQTENESDAQRVSDTFRVISLSFSNLGGSDSVKEWFATKGRRAYEDRVYSHLGEFYLEKLRYQDAAKAYTTFVDLHPLHRSAPRFGMRVIEVYEAGGFPRLVLESKKQFAATYGLESEYWRHFDPQERPEVLDHLRANLEDLANHYHAEYQNEDLADERDANFAEAHRWYRAYLASFPEGESTSVIHFQLADLLLEHEEYGESALEYEHIAYAYAEHEKSAEAGYAAIYAHRQNLEQVDGFEVEAVKRETVISSLRFVEAFSDHEHAAGVFGAALDDLYDLKEYATTIDHGRRLIDEYPDAEASIVRGAWTVVAHASFDLEDFAEAENAYERALELTELDDESRDEVVENLAASIYKQGEEARAGGELRLAADHFLRIAEAAPASEIRPAAEYDAAAALIELEDWTGAASVLESFREQHPDHALSRDATRQIAFVQREQGNVGRAASEYERVAREADDAETQREALLLAGELHEEAGDGDRALAVYARYVERFPRPLEPAVETRFKIAEIHAERGDQASRHALLREIVAIDRRSGEERTDRVRVLAARSALALTEIHFERFAAIELTQPFARSLKEKRRRMDQALAEFEGLLDYEVGEVTAASTYYMAEIYSDFSQSLMESERPQGIAAADLQDYELMVEEQAFPFEERAIEVHEKNLELMASGLFNPWIQKSLDRLAQIMPGRYAKFEISSGLLASLETYAYRVPRAALVEEPIAPTAGPATEREEPAVNIGTDRMEAAPAESVPAAPAPS